MSSDDAPTPGIVGVATSGIQDVSALLPLLGTEQCEKLVSSALQHGSLYAASVPMSIFGSLGIVKAGFIVLWASMDFPVFPGPKYLRNARITPTGVGELLVHVGGDPQRLYVAEDKIRRHLSKVKIDSFHINFASHGLLWWNARLVVHTALLSGLGLLPYLYIIQTSPQNAPFRTTWIYPLMRVVGCGMVAISIQIIFQLRILEEMSCRLSFLAVDSRLKEEKVPVPTYWDSNRRSKSVLSRLRRRGKLNSKNAPQPDSDKTSQLDSDKTSQLRVDFEETSQLVFKKISEISSVSFPILGRFPKQSTTSTAVEQGGTGKAESSFSLFVRRHGSHYLTTSLLWIARAVLLLGLGMSVAGYIGSFSVVQASPRSDSKGSLIWLLSEAALSIVRTIAWASNPLWDDAQSPIVLKKTTGEKKSSYGIGWKLESVTANDVHALIVDIDSMEGGNAGSQPTHPRPTASAQKVAEYLQDNLLVPRGQIVTLKDEKATKEEIMDALKDLSRRVSVTDDPVIFIYFSTKSFVEDKTTYLTPYLGDEEKGGSGRVPKESGISYTKIAEILQQIARDKTDNITVILECPYAENTGLNNKREAMEEAFVGDSSHILLAKNVSDNVKAGHTQGNFTEALLRVLKDDKNFAHLLSTMRYKDLVKFMNGKVPRPPRSGLAHIWERLNESCGHQDKLLSAKDTNANAFCTTFYQNRLLFNGLFSRKVTTTEIDPLITVHCSDL